jgi:hypothetical protein
MIILQFSRSVRRPHCSSGLSRVVPPVIRRNVCVAILSSPLLSYGLSGVRIRVCLGTRATAFLPRFPYSNPRSCSGPPAVGHLPAQLLFRFLADSAHFCANETHRWHWRTAGDTIVCRANFAAFIDGLDAAHDPLADRVFKGQVVPLLGGVDVHCGAMGNVARGRRAAAAGPRAVLRRRAAVVGRRRHREGGGGAGDSER